MFGRIVKWMTTKASKTAVPVAGTTRFQGGKGSTLVSVPAVPGFELEGLGPLGGGKAKFTTLEKESFRD